MNAAVSGTVAERARERYRATRRVTLVGAGLNAFLVVLQIVVGTLAHSRALVADGFHTLSDLITDLLVLWAARAAHQAPDTAHPYGHQRIETAATVALGGLLCLVAIGIAANTGLRLWAGTVVPAPGFSAIAVAVTCVLAKEGLYRYAADVAGRVGSELLRGAAWHSRSDAFSSVVVIVGIGGAMLGWRWMDGVAAVIVAGMIAWTGADMIVRAIKELIDTGLDAEELEAITGTILAVEGVRDAHGLRTRRMGGDVYLEAHLMVASHLSISEGHRIGEAVRARLKAEFPRIADFTVHMDAEDDAQPIKSDGLPLRGEILERLRTHWRDIPHARRVDRFTLHYLGGKVRVEVWLPMALFDSLDSARRTAAAMSEAAAADPIVEHIDVLFR
jgi:cation diffusion facilitator family transporter